MNFYGFTDNEIEECVIAARAKTARAKTWMRQDMGKPNAPTMDLARRVLVSGETSINPTWDENLREHAAVILARRAPKRERLGPWQPCATAPKCSVRCPVGVSHDLVNHGVFLHEDGAWTVYPSTLADSPCAQGKGGMVAADTAARALYDFDEPTALPARSPVYADGRLIGHLAAPASVGQMVTLPRFAGLTVDGKPVPQVDAIHYHNTIPTRPRVNGPSPVRVALDALLRFVLGMPQAERWMGAETWACVSLGGGESRAGYAIDGTARGLLGRLTAIPAASTNRWLSIAEQREYLRLYGALKAAL